MCNQVVRSTNLDQDSVTWKVFLRETHFTSHIYDFLNMKEADHIFIGIEWMSFIAFWRGEIPVLG
jgi:hypothetical protein